MALTFTHLSCLLPMIQPYAGHCPAFLITQAARLAAVEMCERTRCWRHILTFDAASATVPDLIPMEAVIWEIETAEADGCPLVPVQHSDVLGDPQPGQPRYISQINPWGVLLHPFPDNTGPLSVEMSVFLKPRSDMIVGLVDGNPLLDSLNVVPDWMVQQHAERLADGALARVLMMEGESWYSPQRAAVHQARFDIAMDRNFAFNIRGQQRSRARTRYHDF